MRAWSPARVVLRGGTPAGEHPEHAGRVDLDRLVARRRAAPPRARSRPRIQPGDLRRRRRASPTGPRSRPARPSAISPQRAVRNFREIVSSSRCGRGAQLAPARRSRSSPASAATATTPSRSVASKVRAADDRRAARPSAPTARRRGWSTRQVDADAQPAVHPAIGPDRTAAARTGRASRARSSSRTRAR